MSKISQQEHPMQAQQARRYLQHEHLTLVKHYFATSHEAQDYLTILMGTVARRFKDTERLCYSTGYEFPDGSILRLAVLLKNSGLYTVTTATCVDNCLPGKRTREREAQAQRANTCRE